VKPNSFEQSKQSKIYEFSKDHKRIKIEMEAFVLSKEMKEVFEILKMFQIEEFVCFEPEDIPNLLDISYPLFLDFKFISKKISRNIKFRKLTTMKDSITLNSKMKKENLQKMESIE
jgi:hypothetical protein